MSGNRNMWMFISPKMILALIQHMVAAAWVEAEAVFWHINQELKREADRMLMLMLTLTWTASCAYACACTEWDRERKWELDYLKLKAIAAELDREWRRLDEEWDASQRLFKVTLRKARGATPADADADLGQRQHDGGSGKNGSSKRRHSI